MVAALVWWSILLFRENEKVWITRQNLIQKEYAILYDTPNFDIVDTPEYLTYQKEYLNQKRMILGETVIFVFVLIIGIYLIYKSYKKELLITENQKNFLLSITHELRSPITSIKLSLETLLKRKPPKEIEENIINNSIEESNRLNSLINNLLLATRISYSYPYHFKTENLYDVIVECVNSMQSCHPECTINFTAEGNSNVHLEIDKQAIISMVSNIIENAVKYGKNQDVDVKFINQKEVVSIHIKDKGPGIPEEEKNKIFNQFYRIGSEETRQEKGTGLGLYIAGKIAKAHKAKIEVNSDLNKGSIFTIRFHKHNV